MQNRIAAVAIGWCLVLGSLTGCGSSSSTPVAPKAQNPNPDLQPASRGAIAGSEGAVTAEALGGN